MIEIILNSGEYFSGENYHNNGNIFNGYGFIQSTDSMELEIAVNGKVLHETLPIVTISGLKTFYTNSGEFFLSGYELKDETGRYILPNESNLTYDWISDSGRFFYEDDIHAEMTSGFSGVIGDLLSGGHVFLNGQKLVSGESYIENVGVWEWSDPDTDVTGVLFSMANKPHVYHSGVYDIIETYNRNGFIAYLNGIKLTDEEFLQLGSVVSNINTGLEPTIEFNFPQNEQVFFL